MTWIVIILLLALIFDFINGFHDTANAIATSISTKALPPRFAVFYAAVLNLFGALSSTAVAQSIGGKIADPLHIANGPTVVVAALFTSIVWGLVTWRYGIPSSSSHALIGSLAGAVMMAAGWNSIKWHGFIQIIESLVFSPILALLLGFAVMIILKYAFWNASPHRVNRGFRFFQIFSAGLQAFSHGGNDAQKTMGIIVFALVAGKMQTDLTVPLWVKLIAAIAMGLGTSVGGWRIIKTVGSKIIKLEPINGFASDLTSSMIIQGATAFGLPVSTTHVISSAVMGTGAAKNFRAVHWDVAQRIVSTWIITLPITALLSACVYWILSLFTF